MVKLSALYTGDQNCILTHGPSGAKIETDAPVDNGGKGAAFSPTDLVAAAEASCILTVMAMGAEREGVSLKGASLEIEKHMVPSPRRIGQLNIKISMPKGVPSAMRPKLESIAHHCPVHNSIRADIETKMEFIYPD